MSVDELTKRALVTLNDLRNDGKMWDAIIKAGSRTFPVHRNIMSASSAYFRALFSVGQGSRSKVKVKFKVKVKGQGQLRRQRGKIGPKIAISTVYEPKPQFSCNSDLS